LDFLFQRQWAGLRLHARFAFFFFLATYEQ